jgi:hypothetical protein
MVTYTRQRYNTYILREHLIDMSIKRDTLPVWRLHEPRPVAQRLESVVDQHDVVALLRGAKREAVELSLWTSEG